MQLSYHIGLEHGSRMKLRRLADHPQSKFLTHPAGNSHTYSVAQNAIFALNLMVIVTVNGVSSIPNSVNAGPTLIRCMTSPAKLELTLPTYTVER
jgi:hypothetical protein